MELQKAVSKKKNILLIGPAGTGKTTLAASMWQLGNVHFVDVDKKLDQMADELYERWPESEGKITFMQPSGTLTGKSRLKFVSSPNQAKPSEGRDAEMRPRGYEQVINEVSDWIVKSERGEKLPFETLVLDSYTRLREHLKVLLKKEHQHAVITQHDWGTILENDENFMHGILSLPCNVVVICHEKQLLSKEGYLIKYIPSIQGQFGSTVGSFFQETYFTRVKTHKSGMVAYVIAKGSGTLDCARSSLVEYKHVPSDMARIIHGDFRGEAGRAWRQTPEAVELLGQRD